MVRSAVDPRTLDQALFAEQEAGSLRAPDTFAAAVADSVGAALQVDVGDGQNLRRCIHEDRDVLAASGLCNHFRADRTVISRTGKNIGHRGALVERAFQL